jgi:hypothetical protein
LKSTIDCGSRPSTVAYTTRDVLVALDQLVPGAASVTVSNPSPTVVPLLGAVHPCAGRPGWAVAGPGGCENGPSSVVASISQLPGRDAVTTWVPEGCTTSGGLVVAG